MTLFTLGVSHKTAPVAVRERLAFSPHLVAPALKDLCASTATTEVALLSTCNRTEMYCSFTDPEAVLHWWRNYLDLKSEDIRPFVYTYSDSAAVKHVMRVACGLDSMLVGEPQILGQLKTAYQTAGEIGVLGRYLDRLFQNSFSVAKRVRRETEIGSHPVSIAFSAVNLSKQIFADLKHMTVLLVGAGQTIELLAKHLWQQGVRRMIVANRSLQAASRLAATFQGQAIGLEAIEYHLAESDMVVTATASGQPIILPNMLPSAIKARKRRPILMIDLSVPRNIHPDIGQFEDVYLYCIDDLQHIVDRNLQSRLSAAETAEHLIQLQTDAYMTWFKAEEAIETLKKFRNKIEQVKSESTMRALNKLKNGQSPETVIAHLVHNLSQKFLHYPSVKLRSLDTEERHLIESIKQLYDIE
ncbi:MAG: glutamyl-tRNA reductase [Gammaproteobacteria bacterium]